MAEARRWADEVAANPPLAVAAAKRGMRFGLDSTFEANAHFVMAELRQLMRTADFQEGVQSFVEKRPRPTRAADAGRRTARTRRARRRRSGRGWRARCPRRATCAIVDVVDPAVERLLQRDVPGRRRVDRRRRRPRGRAGRAQPGAEQRAVPRSRPRRPPVPHDAAPRRAQRRSRGAGCGGPKPTPRCSAVRSSSWTASTASSPATARPTRPRVRDGHGPGHAAPLAPQRDRRR